MPTIRLLNDDRRIKSSIELLSYGKNVHSQAGEDGILEEVFKRIGATNKWCVEFGAWDGLLYSNTANLIRNHGWKAVMIEGNAERAAEIRKNYPDPKQVIAACAMVGFDTTDNLDYHLSRTRIPKAFDLISIDVDGVDWHVWDSIKKYKPRVVIIEFNPTIPNNVIFVQDRDMALNEGCSVSALVELGKSKGYQLAAVTSANAIFVTDQEFTKLGIPNNNIHALRIDRQNYLWVAYNGKIYNTMSQPRWNFRHIDLHNDSLQYLAKFRFHGTVQGVHRAMKRPDGLNDADAILREIFQVRYYEDNKDPLIAERRQTAWIAAREYVERNLLAVEAATNAHDRKVPSRNKRTVNARSVGKREKN